MLKRILYSENDLAYRLLVQVTKSLDWDKENFWYNLSVYFFVLKSEQPQYKTIVR